MKKILWILKDIPCSGGFSAGNLRLYNLLQHLAKSGKYKIIVRGNQANYGMGDLQGLGIDVAFNQSINHVITQDINPDIIIVSWYGILNTYYNHIKSLFPNVPLICDTVDVNFTRLEKELSSDNALFIKEKEKEIQTYKCVDKVLVVSENDRKKLLKYNIDSDIVSCCYKYNKNIVAENNSIEHGSISFQGFFLHRPNVEAAFKSMQIFREVVEKRLNSKLYIVGKHAPKELIDLAKKEKNVHVTGVIYNFERFMSKIEVSLAPIVYGSGINGKILYCMNKGIPVVTSTRGAIGIEQLIHERNCFIHVVDSEKSINNFSNSIIKLLDSKDLRVQLAKNANKVIKEHYSIKIVGDKLIDVLEGCSN